MVFQACKYRIKLGIVSSPKRWWGQALMALNRDRCSFHPGHIRHQHRRPIRKMDQYVQPCPVGGQPDLNLHLDDIFVSTPHRVLPPTQTRYSIPFFFGSDHDVPLIPPSTCVSSDRPAKYPVVTAGAYVHSRLSETYNYQGDEA